MAAGAGVEPASSESKSSVLPVTLSRKIGARGETRTHDIGFAIRCLGPLGDARKLELLAGFEPATATFEALHSSS